MHNISKYENDYSYCVILMRICKIMCWDQTRDTMIVITKKIKIFWSAPKLGLQCSYRGKSVKKSIDFIKMSCYIDFLEGQF